MMTSSDTYNMEQNETAAEEQTHCPASPARLRNEHRDDSDAFVDPFAKAIKEEQGTSTKNEFNEMSSHRPNVSSLVSGYETARQTPMSNECNPYHWRGNRERFSSFVSSSSSNTGLDRGVLPTAQSLQFDSSPERESKHDVHDNDDDGEDIRMRERETLNALVYTSDSANEISNSYPENRQRTSSDDFYLLMKSESHNNSGLKFYESDIDSVNGSVVYKRNSLSRTNSRRMSGGDSDVYHVSAHRGAWHTTPSRNSNKNDSFATPQVANLSKKREEPKSGHGYVVDETTDIGIDANAVDFAVLPYQARKQLKQKNNMLECNANDPNDDGQFYDNGNYEQAHLSTIAAPYIPKSSPTHAYSSGLPPSGPRRSRSFSKDSAHVAEDRMNWQQNHRDESFKRNDGQINEGHEIEAPLPNVIQRPPPLHFRMESTGSVSSLGSTMDGASSMAQHDTERLSMKLERDIQQYHNDNSNNSDVLPSRAGKVKRSGKESPGFLSHLVDSMSFTSAGSFKSVEDERADYRKKGTKFLKKAEKLKKKLNTGSRGWFQEFVGDGQ
jgi:hypothetical protein